jgi:hypothetical protein
MDKTRFIEHGEMRGILEVRVFKDGKLVDRFEERNLIVNAARVQMAHLIAGDVGERSIKFISFGTSGGTPQPSDTTITNAYTKEVSGFEYPAMGQCQVNWELSTSEANGKAIMEFGLLTEDETLFCRRVRTTPINKEADISLEGTWTIIF